MSALIGRMQILGETEKMNDLELIYSEAQSGKEYARRYASYVADILTGLDFQTVDTIIDVFRRAWSTGNTVYFAGNGGSATTCSHFAEDLVLGIATESEKPCRALSLTDNTALITAVGNDEGYENIFVAQLRRVLNEGDILVAISGSGNSQNVIKAVEYVNSMGGVTVGILGFDGGMLKNMCVHYINVGAAHGAYGPVEDAHLAVSRNEFALQLEEPPSLDEAKERLAEVQATAEEELEKARQAAGGKPVDEKKALNWFTERTLRGTEELVEALERGEAEFTIPMEAQAIAIGDCAIVGMPGEVFVKIGLTVTEQSPFARTIPISHTNGSPGYIPTADQVPLGGYEVEQAHARRYGLFIVPESDQAMIDGALAALQKCYDALHE